MSAPIILFVYNRYDHTTKVIDALAKNKEAKESTLYIFSDAAKNEKALSGVKAVREYIDSLQNSKLFGNVIIEKAEKNKGLADSVIYGVDKVIKKHKKAIIIEDDAICSEDFLEFMNNSLDFYENNEKIWFIGGYSPNIRIPDDYKHDVFINGRGSSYSWATWEDRWNRIDWDVCDYSNFKINFVKRYKFNKFGQDRSAMLDDQMHGKINSWAIRFSYAMFCNDMYAVLPVHSRIKCIGNDGSGTHCGNSHTFDVDIVDYGHKINLENLDVDERIRKNHAQFFKTSFFNRFKRYVKTNILNK